VRRKPSDELYSEQETTQRAEAALKRMLSTPPKLHSEMKLGKHKAEASAKAGSPKKTRQASKGRVHKGKTRA